MMSSVSSVVRRLPIITFFVLSYAISWAFLPVESVRFLPSGPLFAALIVTPITQGLSGLKELGLRMIRWRVRWYWYVVAIALPLAAVMLTVGLSTSPLGLAPRRWASLAPLVPSSWCSLCA